MKFDQRIPNELYDGSIADSFHTHDSPGIENGAVDNVHLAGSITEVKMAAAATQTISGNDFVVAHSDSTVVELIVNNGDFTSHATTPIAAGSVDGQILTILLDRAFFATANATIQDLGNCTLQGNWVGAVKGQWLSLVWSDSKWIEKGRGLQTNTNSGKLANSTGGFIVRNTGDYTGSAGGTYNTNSGDYTGSAGGTDNTNSGDYGGSVGGTGHTNSGNYTATTGGESNTFTASHLGVAGGKRNVVGANYAAAVGGYLNCVSHHYCGILGSFRAKATLYAQQAHAAGQFAAQGDAQVTRCIGRIATPSDTPAIIYLDGTDDRHIIGSERTHGYTVTTTAREDDGVANGMWKHMILIRNNAGTTAQVGATQLIASIKDGITTDPIIVADVTNDALLITVTGLSSRPIRWVSLIEVVEIGY